MQIDADDNPKKIHVISLGAGVQSTTLLMMAARGEFPVMPRCAIFADTRWEPPAVYKHLEFLEEEVGHIIPIIRVTAGNIKEDSLRAISADIRKSESFITMPLYVRNYEGKGAVLRRQCTRFYKIAPIQQKLRELIDRGSGASVDLWLGISLDEAIWRMKPSRVQWITHRYPLVERKMTRHDCLMWMERHGYPKPPKSACIGCPYHSNAVWREMKINDPGSFQQAVEFDNAVRIIPRVEGETFIYQKMVPLSEADLSTEEERGQLNLFLNECEGMCGL